MIHDPKTFNMWELHPYSEVVISNGPLRGMRGQIQEYQDYPERDRGREWLFIPYDSTGKYMNEFRKFWVPESNLMEQRHFDLSYDRGQCMKTYQCNMYIHPDMIPHYHGAEKEKSPDYTAMCFIYAELKRKLVLMLVEDLEDFTFDNSYTLVFHATMEKSNVYPRFEARMYMRVEYTKKEPATFSIEG